jgi:ribosomal protein S18 acetylase RimI-like enzyme
MLIQTVSDNEALQNWVMIVARSYKLPRHIAGSLFENYSDQGFRPYPPFRLYLGSVKSGPVAAGLLLLGIHSAGIYNVGTLPEGRRRGYGAAITRHAMLKARELGYPIAALASTEMGVGIYQRLGFVECCRLEIYEIKKPKKR